jgi:hydroxymethylpyrimidine pyrophosphatase-like HAD family hydrolase
MDQRLAAIDLDGTLVGRSGQISAADRDALVAWWRSGRKIAILSGRSPSGMHGVLAEVGVPYFAGAFNGALVWYQPEGFRPAAVINQLVDSPLPDISATALWSFCVRHRLTAMYYSCPAIFASNANATIRREIAITGEQVSYSTSPSIGLPAYKISVYLGESPARHEEMGPLLRGVSWSLSRSGTLEVTSSRSDKGKALIEICGRLGVPIESVVAIGDGDNDVAMLSIAGSAWSMPDSSQLARSVAKSRLGGSGTVAQVLRQAMDASIWARRGPAPIAQTVDADRWSR